MDFDGCGFSNFDNVEGISDCYFEVGVMGQIMLGVLIIVGVVIKLWGIQWDFFLDYGFGFVSMFGVELDDGFVVGLLG